MEEVQHENPITRKSLRALIPDFVQRGALSGGGLGVAVAREFFARGIHAMLVLVSDVNTLGRHSHNDCETD